MSSVFVATTYGLISGKTWGWTFVCWGAPLFNLGYTIFAHHFDYGTDPHAMIGWENQTKIPFFAQIMFCGWVRGDALSRLFSANSTQLELLGFEVLFLEFRLEF